MSDAVLIVGPHRQIYDLFDPVWSELELEEQRFISTDAAIEVLQSGRPPSAVLVSYPLWDTSLDELLSILGRTLPSERPVPVVVLTSEALIPEIAGLEERGIRVLSEDGEPDALKATLRDLLARARRAHPRFIVRMEVQVGDGSVLRACQTEDISLTGMLIRTSEEFPLGSQVALEFAPHPDEEPLQCRAEVMRYTHPDVEGMCGIGVHFLSFTDDGFERLEAFLSR